MDTRRRHHKQDCDTNTTSPCEWQLYVIVPGNKRISIAASSPNCACALDSLPIGFHARHGVLVMRFDDISDRINHLDNRVSTRDAHTEQPNTFPVVCSTCDSNGMPNVVLLQGSQRRRPAIHSQAFSVMTNTWNGTMRVLNKEIGLTLNVTSSLSQHIPQIPSCIQPSWPYFCDSSGQTSKCPGDFST